MISVQTAFDPLRLVLEQAKIRYAVGGSWASTAFGDARFTNDVDILVEFTQENLSLFLDNLADAFYVNAEDARAAIRAGRSFNVIHMETAFKFDLFPAAAFILGTDELDRAIRLSDSGLSRAAIPFVTAEDILLAKLYWFRLGGEVSNVQWRDIEGLLRQRGSSLDLSYLSEGSDKIGVADLLAKALAGPA